MWQAHYLTVGKEKINYKIRETGDLSASKAVLLIHGQAWTGEAWTMVAEKLQGIHVIAPDMAGHGDSDETSDNSFDHLSEQLLDILDQLNIEKVWIAAHSWGASLALNFADKYSERVRGFMLLDGGYFNYQEWPGISWAAFTDFSLPEAALESVDAYVRFQSEDTPFWNEKVEKAVRDQVSETKEGKAALKCLLKTELACAKALWNFDPDHYIAHINFPSYLVVARPDEEDDKVREFKTNALNHFEAVVKDCQVVRLENTSHMIMLERPETTADLIWKMIEKK